MNEKQEQGCYLNLYHWHNEDHTFAKLFIDFIAEVILDVDGFRTRLADPLFRT